MSKTLRKNKDGSYSKEGQKETLKRNFKNFRSVRKNKRESKEINAKSSD